MSDTTTEIQDGLLVLQQIQEPGRVRLALHGELDLTNTATLEVALNAALASGDDVLVDLAKLEFLDSTGISLLVRATLSTSGLQSRQSSASAGSTARAAALVAGAALFVIAPGFGGLVAGIEQRPGSSPSGWQWK